MAVLGWNRRRQSATGGRGYVPVTNHTPKRPRWKLRRPNEEQVAALSERVDQGLPVLTDQTEPDEFVRLPRTSPLPTLTELKAMNDKIQLQEQYIDQERRKKVADMYLGGKAQWQIARILGVSEGEVARDLQHLREVWTADFNSTSRDGILEQLAKINLLEETARDAWLRSCQTETTQKVTRKKAMRNELVNGKPTGKAKLVLVEEVDDTTTRQKIGDPRFLDQIRWCVETRLKLIGALEGTANTAQVQICWESLYQPPPKVVDPLEEKIAAVKALTNQQPPKPPPSSTAEPHSNGDSSE